MSINCDKAALKTEVNTTFVDLIDSMALQCTQIDSESLKGLFMIAGRIELTWSGSANTVKWRDGGYNSINAKNALGTSIGFSGTPALIQLTYPSAFTTGKTVKPIATFVGQDISMVSTNPQQTSFAYATQPTALYTNIIISRQVKYSGSFQYGASASATNFWGISAIYPLAYSILSSRNPSTGVGYVIATNMAGGTTSFKMPFDMVGAPMLTPMPPGTGINPYFLTVSLDASDKSLFYVDFYDIVTGSKITPSTSNNPGFYADFGVTDNIVDAQTTNFVQGGILYFFGLFQSVDNP